MKELHIPYIEKLETLEFGKFELEMELNGTRAFIDCVNWASQYPYRPDTAFAIARSETHLCILFHVRGLDLRAKAMEDNGRVWEDSCCEFFVSDPQDGTYYNFEMNCVGTLLASKRKNREDCIHFNAEQMSRIIRHSTLPKVETDQENGIFAWSVAMCIPFRLIGINPIFLPSALRGNFFKCGDRTGHPHFLSWNPVNTPSPDFHRPEFFGELTF